MPGGFIPPEQIKSPGARIEPWFCGAAYKNNMYALLGKPGYDEPQGGAGGTPELILPTSGLAQGARHRRDGAFAPQGGAGGTPVRTPVNFW